MLPVLRGALASYGPAILALDDSAEVLSFVNSKHAEDVSQVGAACPDHLVHTKMTPLFVNWKPEQGTEALVARIRSSVAQYVNAYQSYFERNATHDQVMFAPSPRVVLIPGLGMITAGADATGADVSAQLYRRAIVVMTNAARLRGFVSLSPEESFGIEYWPLELYKLSLKPAPRALAGKVALVTGSASGIGQLSWRSRVTSSLRPQARRRPASPATASATRTRRSRRSASRSKGCRRPTRKAWPSCHRAAALPATAQPLAAELKIRLREASGRTIERRLSLPIDLKQPRIGIKPLFAGNEVGEGETAGFDVILLDPSGAPVAAKALGWQLHRLNQSLAMVQPRRQLGLRGGNDVAPRRQRQARHGAGRARPHHPEARLGPLPARGRPAASRAGRSPPSSSTPAGRAARRRHARVARRRRSTSRATSPATWPGEDRLAPGRPRAGHRPRRRAARCHRKPIFRPAAARSPSSRPRAGCPAPTSR